MRRPSVDVKVVWHRDPYAKVGVLDLGNTGTESALLCFALVVRVHCAMCFVFVCLEFCCPYVFVIFTLASLAFGAFA